MGERLESQDENQRDERRRDSEIIESLNDLKQAEWDLLEKWRIEGGLDKVHEAELEVIQRKIKDLEALQRERAQKRMRKAMKGKL